LAGSGEEEEVGEEEEDGDEEEEGEEGLEERTVPLPQFRALQAKTMRYAKKAQRETRRRASAEAHAGKAWLKIKRLQSELAAMYALGSTAKPKEAAPGAATTGTSGPNVIGTLAQNRSRENHGQRYPDRDVWGAHHMHYPSPAAYRNTQDVLRKGEDGGPIMSERTMYRRTKAERDFYGAHIADVRGIPAIVAALMRRHGLKPGGLHKCNLMVDVTSTTPDGSPLAGRKNHGVVVVMLAPRAPRVSAIPLHRGTSDVLCVERRLLSCSRSSSLGRNAALCAR
jgi:hypothetical protein